MFLSSEYQDILDHCGSWKEFQRILGLSSNDLQFIRIQNPTLSLDKLTTIGEEDFRAALNRYESIKILSMIYRCKESEVRSKARSFGIEIKHYSRPIGETAGIGRRGELFFKLFYEHLIKNDAYKILGNTAPYDFQLMDDSRVNVKTASGFLLSGKQKSGPSVSWQFSFKGANNCDSFALIPIHRNGSMKQILNLRAADVKRLGLEHIIIYGSDLMANSSALIFVESKPVGDVTAMSFELILNNTRYVKRLCESGTLTIPT